MPLFICIGATVKSYIPFLTGCSEIKIVILLQEMLLMVSHEHISKRSVQMRILHRSSRTNSNILGNIEDPEKRYFLYLITIPHFSVFRLRGNQGYDTTTETN